jgi:pimeloyl-ACP methyl ester carboxylesterase
MNSTPREWVLLRGLTREARHWGRFPQHLCAALDGARVTCLDLPGNGQQNRMASLASVEAMADWCHAELARRGSAFPCGVVAMSLGAMVATAWAQRHPGDLAAAVLINTSLRPFSPFYRRMRPANYLRLIRLFGLNASERKLETAILQMTTRLLPDPASVIEQWLQWRRENPVTRRNALLQLLAAARYRAPRKRPLDRLLLLAGGADRLVDPHCSSELARAWNVPLHIHPEGGHDLPLDDEAWVLQHILAWIGLDEGDDPGACANSCNGGATKA